MMHRKQVMMCSKKTCRPIVDYREKVRSGRELIAHDVAHFHDADLRNNADCCAAGDLGIAPWNCRLTTGETGIVLSKAD
jgi:hypothetical protein